MSGPLLVEANLRLTYSIGLIASLGFLGFATKVNAADWGMMVNENRAALVTQPWGTVLPALAIALLTVGTGLIADAVLILGALRGVMLQWFLDDGISLARLRDRLLAIVDRALAAR